MSSQAFNFTGLSSQTTAPITVNVGEKLRLRLSTMSGRPQLAVQLTQNGVSDTGSLLSIAAGEAVDLLVGAPGDSVSIIYTGQTSLDAVSGILESIPAVAPTVSTVSPANLPATSSPVSGTYNSVGSETLGPFTPQLARSIWFQAQAAGASGSINILRSIDGGSTKPGLTQGGQAWASYTFGASAAFTGTIANEPINIETSALATYFIQIVLTAGSVGVDLHQ